MVGQCRQRNDLMSSRATARSGVAEANGPLEVNSTPLPPIEDLSRVSPVVYRIKQQTEFRTEQLWH